MRRKRTAEKTRPRFIIVLKRQKTEPGSDRLSSVKEKEREVRYRMLKKPKFKKKIDFFFFKETDK